MSGNSLEWRNAPGRTKVLAVVAAGLIVLGVWWLAASLSRENPPAPALILFGLLLLMLGVALVGVVCVVEYRRLQGAGALRSALAPPFERPWPLGRGMRWITVEPSVYRRNLLLLRFRLVAAAVLTIVAAAAVVSSRSHSALQWFVGLFCASCVAYAWVFLILEARSIERARAMRIGTDGVNAMFDAGRGDIESVGLDTVRVDDFSMLIGRRIVRLSDPWRRTTFPKDALRGILLARLRGDAFVKNGWIPVLALGRGNVGMIVSALGIVAAIAFVVLLELRPAGMESVTKTFAQWLVERAR
jgi:hypothetical protein